MLAPMLGMGQTYDISDEQARLDLTRVAVMVLSYAAQSARGLGKPIVPQSEVDQGDTLAEKFLIRWKRRGRPHPRQGDRRLLELGRRARHERLHLHRPRDHLHRRRRGRRVLRRHRRDERPAARRRPLARARHDRGRREERRRRGLRQEAARRRRAADGLRPPRLPRRGPARPRAASYGEGARTPRATRSPRQLEKAALAELKERRPDRVLETNVEFWAAIVLDFAEVPANMFTSMFTCARTGGWSAHILEQKTTGPLIRPSAIYVGPGERAGQRHRGLERRVGRHRRLRGAGRLAVMPRHVGRDRVTTRSDVVDG